MYESNLSPRAFSTGGQGTDVERQTSIDDESIVVFVGYRDTSLVEVEVLGTLLR